MTPIERRKEKYGYEIDGLWMPRVTAITSIVLTDHLLRYYARHRSFSDVRERLLNSARWGTRLHEAIANILRGEKCTEDPEIAPSLESFLQWKNEYKVKVLSPKDSIEKRVVDREFWYAGTVDVIAEINGVRGVLDIKTGNGIWETYSLQTAAYLRAYNLQEKKKCETRWILRVDQYRECLGCLAQKREKDGRASVRGGKRFCNHQWGPSVGATEFQRLDNEKEDVEAFLAAQELWEWCNRDWISRIPNHAKRA